MPVVDVIMSFTPHDAGLMAWAVVGACLAASALAFGLMRRRRGRERLFWLIVFIVMLGLGLNKQLDLQSDVTRVFRTLAREQGWYAQRRAVQAAFVVVLAISMAGGAALLAWLAARASAGARLAMLGMVLLAGFVLLRAASFHHVDFALRTMVAGSKIYNVIEVAGALIVVAGALLARRSSRRRR